MAIKLLNTSGSQKRFLIPDSLIHSAGTITAIFGSKFYSTFLTGLVANTLYYLYILPNGTMVFSTSANSIGPAGQSAWTLIGAFYANGLAIVGFGTFVNIEGPPSTSNVVRSPISMFRNADTLGWASGPASSWSRNGRLFSMTYSAFADNVAPNGGAIPFVIAMPNNLGFMAQAGLALSQDVEIAQENGGFIGAASMSIINAISDWVQLEMYSVGPTSFYLLAQPAGVGTLLRSSVSAGTVIQGNIYNLPLTIWSNTPLKDL